MTAPVRPGDTARLRLSVVGIVVLSLFAALFSRLWYLQVVSSTQAEVRVANNQIRLVHEEAPRGRILDRNGRVLVDNRVSQVITVNRTRFPGDVETTTRLAALLGIPPGVLGKRINDPRYSPYKPVPVAEDVPEETVVYLAEHAEDFPGVEAAELSDRNYLHASLAAHVLGYVGEINDRELKERKAKGYRLGDNIGKSGVERAYEDHLRGTPGVTKLEVDSKGRVLRTLDSRPPIQGADLQLTVDLDVQRLAEESLAQGIAAARQAYDRDRKKNYPAPGGSVVVLDPKDGSVVAMASFPTYNPADFRNGIRPDVYAALTDPASAYPLNNRAVQGEYAPGSTFKLVTAMAGLRSGMITPGTPFVDNGQLRIGNRTFRNAGSRPYGRINLAQSLVVSSDTYYYQLGANFWNGRDRYGDGIQQVAKELGYGQRTGIPIGPEARGRVPDPDLKRKMHEDNPTAFPEGRWFTGDNANLAVGQGDTVATPLQLASSYATFANGGTVYQPRVASRVLTQDGSVIEEVQPAAQRKVDLPPSMRDPILAGLRGVVANDSGTAHPAFAGFPHAQFPVAGKTGTAEVEGKHDTALFVAFAPAHDPQYVISVVVEEGGFGGSTAAPIARRIFDGLAGRAPTPIAVGGGID